MTGPEPRIARGGATMSDATPPAGRPITGRTVLFIAIAFFGVVIGVNVLMATLAVGGFPGVVSDNPYFESQHFNAELKEERALGWRFAADYADDELTVRIVGADGAPLDGLTVEAVVGRPATLQEDRTVQLAPEPGLPGAYGVTAPLGAGMWRVEIKATGAKGERYHITDEIYVSPKDAAPGTVGALE